MGFFLHLSCIFLALKIYNKDSDDGERQMREKERKRGEERGRENYLNHKLNCDYSRSQKHRSRILDVQKT